MRATFLAFSPPLIGEEEIAEVTDTLRSDWITTGPKVTRFEQAFAGYIGAPDALAVNSCTAALQVALATLGVGPGDAVITTPMTFCSTVHVIENTGARPLLVDVEPEDLHMDINLVREALAKDKAGRIKSIIPVHLYGKSCDMDLLLAAAGEHNCAVVEDAAHALPALYKGRLIGGAAPDSPVRRATCFSFYATKNMTTAEGGMLTGTHEFVENARAWALHGMSRDAWKRYGDEGSWTYDVVCPGFKSNMTDIQAALGLQQLRKLSAFHRRRKQIAERYNAAFANVVELRTLRESLDREHAWHIYALRLNLHLLTLSRDEFMIELKRRNIGASVHFIPIHLFSYYRSKYGYKPNDFPVAYREYQRLVSLPCSPRMSDEDVQDVIEAVSSIVRGNKRAKVFAAMGAVS